MLRIASTTLHVTTAKHRDQILNAGVEIAKVNPNAAATFLIFGIPTPFNFNQKEHSPHVVRMLKLASDANHHSAAMQIAKWGMEQGLIRPIRANLILQLAEKIPSTNLPGLSALDSALAKGVLGGLFQSKHVPKILDLTQHVIENGEHYGKHNYNYGDYTLAQVAERFKEHKSRAEELMQARKNRG